MQPGNRHQVATPVAPEHLPVSGVEVAPGRQPPAQQARHRVVAQARGNACGQTRAQAVDAGCRAEPDIGGIVAHVTAGNKPTPARGARRRSHRVEQSARTLQAQAQLLVSHGASAGAASYQARRRVPEGQAGRHRPGLLHAQGEAQRILALPRQIDDASDDDNIPPSSSRGRRCCRAASARHAAQAKPSRHQAGDASAAAGRGPAPTPAKPAAPAAGAVAPGPAQRAPRPTIPARRPGQTRSGQTGRGDAGARVRRRCSPRPPPLPAPAPPSPLRPRCGSTRAGVRRAG